MPSNPAYVIRFTDTAFRNFKRYPIPVRKRIMWRIKQLAADPYKKSNVKALHLTAKPYRLRVGKYRILYEVGDDLKLIDILPRQKVYRKYRF